MTEKEFNELKAFAQKNKSFVIQGYFVFFIDVIRFIEGKECYLHRSDNELSTLSHKPNSSVIIAENKFVFKIDKMPGSIKIPYQYIKRYTIYGYNN